MPFEKATEKFQRAVDDLKSDGRPLHNDDNVDSIWLKIICSDYNSIDKNKRTQKKIQWKIKHLHDRKRKNSDSVSSDESIK